MKKLILTSCFGMAIFASAFAQPVHDRAVIPVAVTLEQILRVKVITGGNIEFVFNDINDYKNGMGNLVAGFTAGNFYTTTFSVASSTNWQLDFGAEDATFLGTDDPANTALTLDNVGIVTTVGTFAYGAEYAAAAAPYANAGTATPDALVAFTGSGTAILATRGAGNGGDANENFFTIDWQCGIAQGTMNAATILSQSLAADRYVTNVLIELTAL